MSTIDIAPGWLLESGREIFGALHLGPDGDLAFLECDPDSGAPRAVHRLCTFGEYRSTRRAGLFRKSLEVRAAGGKAWSIRLDRDRMENRHQRMLVGRLDWIIEFERRESAAEF